MIVDLSPSDITQASLVGVMRNVSALKDGRQLETGRIDPGWERHITGAIGEYALARALDVAWVPLVGRLDKKRGDVAGFQVRTTYRTDGHLIVKPEDEPGRYALAVVLGLRVVLPGWIDAGEAKQEAWWRGVGGGVHHAAWFVPQGSLHPLGSEAEVGGLLATAR